MPRQCFCERPATDGDLCAGHAHRFTRELQQGPGWLDTLEDTVTLQARQGAGATTGERLPFNEAASTTEAALRSLLRQAARAAGYPHAALAPLPSCVAHALADRRALLGSPRAQDLAVQLHEVMVAARRITDRVPEKRQIGTCPCGAGLRTTRTTGRITCPHCHAEWDIAATIEARERAVRDLDVTPAEAAAYFREVLGARLSEAQVRKYAMIDLVQSTGQKGRARTYRMGQVMAAWQVTHPDEDLPGTPGA